MLSKKAVTIGIFIALSTNAGGVQASPLRAQIHIRERVIASARAPMPIAIAPTRSVSRPTSIVYDGLGDRNSAIDAYNVAIANARPQSPIEMPGEVQSDATIRMSSTKAGPLYYGTVYDSMSSRPLSGATITLGQVPNMWACGKNLSCGRPAGKLYRATTNASGTFGIATLPPGEYMLTLSKSAAYATLHMQILVRAGHTKLTLRLLALSPDEQAWLNQINYYRSFVSYPRSFPVSIDQYAEIMARKWAVNVADQVTAYGDAAYAPYVHYYDNSYGAMYGAAAVLALMPGTGEYAAADAGWMAEKANCPNGNWVTCPFTDTTGHYMNLSDSMDVWVGVGETNAILGPTAQWAGYSAYDVMEVMNVNSPTPV